MKIAINGFGRIGRNVFKIAWERPGIEIVAINDVADPETLAHLLKFDSTYGVYIRKIRVRDGYLVVDDQEVKVLAEKKPTELPWGVLGIDVVIESTGVFRSAEGENGGYKDHIAAGAKKVILSVDAEDDIDQTIVLGVNDEMLDQNCTAFSNAGCTTNCLAPMVKILHDSIGIEQGLMTTIHAYTNDQVLLDRPHQDLRRARSAATNILPTQTGASSAIERVIPELAGRLNGMAMRVPSITGSVVDLVVKLSRSVEKDELNTAMKEAADGPMKGILEYTEAPIVSSDVRGNSHSVIFDAQATMVLEHGLVKVIGWYDNEFAYSTRVVDLAQKLG